MFKKILCLVIAIMLMLACVGCGDIKKMETDASTKYTPASTSMFVLVEEDIMYYSIVYHKETKVMYAISNGGSNLGTFTVMLDADGKPLLREG